MEKYTRDHWEMDLVEDSDVWKDDHHSVVTSAGGLLRLNGNANARAESWKVEGEARSWWEWGWFGGRGKRKKIL